MIRLVVSVLSVLLFSSPAATLASEILFNRDIRPILSKNCFQCHGPDRNARQANLRLDREKEALTSGVIKPGSSALSKLVKRISTSDPIRLMPPSWSNKKLTEEQISLLSQWIDQGARYEQHWAYIKPERPEAPDGPAGIDYLVNEKLMAMKLQSVGQANRNTLARRLALDLTGLPPSLDVVRTFVDNPNEDNRATEDFVSELLSSPHFGERMAVHWLDLVRYADTMGFHGDVPIPMSPFRDYVINSFNSNKPFDQFTIEQLGGDLLPNPTVWQRVASGYNRLNRMTNEGGAQAKEYLSRYLADRVRATSTIWLGSTLGCAECHDHKFDPFSTKDFYQFASFFADIDEVGVYDGQWDFGPRLRAPSPDSEREITTIDQKLAKLIDNGKGKLTSSSSELQQFTLSVRKNIRSWVTLDARQLFANNSSKIRQRKDGTIQIKRKSRTTRTTGGFLPDIHRVDLKLPKGTVSAIRLEALQFDAEESFLLTRFSLELLRRGSQAMPIPIVAAVDNGHNDRGDAFYTLDDHDQSGWRPSDELNGVTPQAIFLFKSPVKTRPGDLLRVRMYYERQRKSSGLNSFRITSTDSILSEFTPRDSIRDVVFAEGDLTTEQQAMFEEYFRIVTRGNSNWKAIRDLQRNRNLAVQLGTDCLITRAVEPRTVRILPRGNWMDESGEIVKPQSPHFLKEIPVSNRRLTRLDLANWLVHEDNPLTARVFVNRLWKSLFGTGLSPILNDIGSQGETPSNQDLLDWLAVEFMESGWDVKHILRTMVLSKTYRRSSEPNESLNAHDPYNIYYGRQTAIRLNAEFIRDGALTASGLLNPSIGGPSVRPYQPSGYYDELNFPKREYKPDLDDNQFRRGLYTHWQRQYLHPSLMAFDAPAREECAPDRSISNTPLQALTLLNDPTYVEASRAFAQRTLESEAKDTQSRLNFFFQHAFSRSAQSKEITTLVKFLENQYNYFKDHPEDAAKLLAVGISTTPKHLDLPELAAWTSVARAIFNKHEFIVRY